MRRLVATMCGVAVVGAIGVWPIASPAVAAASAPDSDYDRDVVTVVTLGRHSAFPTANCLVWANAEGLGVGPAQLNGFHGVAMNINLKPMPNEAATHPTPFAAGLAELKSKFPTTPAWLTAVIVKNQAAIEAACDKDHEVPFKVYTITPRDKQG